MYKSIASADGWYFTHPNATPNEPPIVYKLAMWALPETEGGEPIGLVTIITKGSPKVVTVPPVEGRYVHRDELPEDQLHQLLANLRSWAN